MTEGRDPVTNRFLPGFSGNPEGGRKGRRITTEIAALLEQEVLGKDGKPSGKTNVQLLAMAMVKHALAGKSHYAMMILDRIEGKVPDVVLAPNIEDMTTEELAEQLRGWADAIDAPDQDADSSGDT